MLRHSISYRFKLVLSLVLLALLLPQAGMTPLVRAEAPDPLAVPGEILIGWQPASGVVPEVRRAAGAFGADRESLDWQAAVARLAELTGLQVVDARPEHGFARLRVRVGDETAEQARLAALSWVRFVQRNHYFRAADAAYPNDPEFPKQWNLHRIKAADAWSATQGSLSFVVAVLDTGVARSHPEFTGQLLTGYNYVDPKQPPEDDSYDGHGTHVTGILAARMNNGAGIAGLAPGIKILPLKVLDGQGNGREDRVAAAIYDATDQRAQVLNLSLAGPSASSLMQNAIAYAQQNGALVVAAAGNCAQDYQNCWQRINPDLYPAAYPGVLAVAASDRFDNATRYSGYKHYIGLAAPGGAENDPIWSTSVAGYRFLYGTSMSTPQVSAAAALVWTLRPAATPEEITDILKSTADKVGADPYSGEPLSYANGRNDYFGSGRLNVANAVRWAYPPAMTAETNDVTLLLGGTSLATTQSVNVVNRSGQSVYWQATVLSGGPWLSLVTGNGIAVYGSASPVAFRAERLDLPPGHYAGTIRVQSVYPSGLLAVDVRVQLRVVSQITRTYAPTAAGVLPPSWLNPDAPGALYRSQLPLTDDGLVTVALPFPVQFYGNTYQFMQVSDNGLVILGDQSANSGRAPTTCPGDGRSPNNAIYVLAHEGNPSLGGQITFHVPDPSVFVISWQNVRRAGNSLAQSFQLVVTRDSTFHANYLTVDTPLMGIIGTENADGTFAQSVLCSGAGRQVKSGEPVYFSTKLPW